MQRRRGVRVLARGIGRHMHVRIDQSGNDEFPREIDDAHTGRKRAASRFEDVFDRPAIDENCLFRGRRRAGAVDDGRVIERDVRECIDSLRRRYVDWSAHR